MEMLGDVAMDANGNGKRDPVPPVQFHSRPPVFFANRRAANNDVSRAGKFFEENSRRCAVNQIALRPLTYLASIHKLKDLLGT